MKIRNLYSAIRVTSGLSSEIYEQVCENHAASFDALNGLSDQQLSELVEAFSGKLDVDSGVAMFFATAEHMHKNLMAYESERIGSDFYIFDDPDVRFLVDPEDIYRLLQFILGKEISESTLKEYAGCIRCMGDERPFEYVSSRNLSLSRLKTCRAAFARKIAENICLLWEQWNETGDIKIWSIIINMTSEVSYLWNKAIFFSENFKGDFSFKKPGFNSKKKILKILPEDWRCCMINGAAHGGDKVRMSTMALTGCRPSEVCSKVLIVREGDGDDFYKFYIGGSKSSPATGGGQPLREVLVNSSYVPAAADVIERAMAGKNEFFLPLENPNSFGKRVSRLAGKVGFKGVSCYCFRHQFCADMKMSKYFSSSISAAMGHVSETSKKFYGHWRSGKNSLGGLVLDIRSSRDVRSRDNEFMRGLTYSGFSDSGPIYER